MAGHTVTRLSHTRSNVFGSLTQHLAKISTQLGHLLVITGAKEYSFSPVCLSLTSWRRCLSYPLTFTAIPLGFSPWLQISGHDPQSKFPHSHVHPLPHARVTATAAAGTPIFNRALQSRSNSKVTSILTFIHSAHPIPALISSRLAPYFIIHIRI